MATQLVIPADTYSFDTNYTFEGNEFNFKIYINKATQRWYLDIREPTTINNTIQENNEILSGLKIMPFQNLTGRYKSVNRKLFSGDIWGMPVDPDFTSLEVVDNTNFGGDLKYGLFYLTASESAEMDLFLQNVIN